MILYSPALVQQIVKLSVCDGGFPDRESVILFRSQMVISRETG